VTSYADKYFENLQQPWWKLFYRLVWGQLPEYKSMNILDFGSGLGKTADHLAEQNTVLAIEQDEQMVERRYQNHFYTQEVGSVARLHSLPDASFDCIICHNVLEYIEQKDEVVEAFSKLLKPDGKISLIKHNHAGRIMAKVVFDNDIEAALGLLDGKSAIAEGFGEIKYYSNEEIVHWSNSFGLKQIDSCGIRLFYGIITDNDCKFNPSWQEKMFELEMRLCRTEPYKSIAFFEHVILEKNL
jgi:2-polyprenyl-3-methyl-5-hydroxy-6-metoxy-1,4-benzoquinol methylase